MPIVSLGPGEVVNISWYTTCGHHTFTKNKWSRIHFFPRFPVTCWDIDGWNQVSHCRHPKSTHLGNQVMQHSRVEGLMLRQCPGRLGRWTCHPQDAGWRVGCNPWESKLDLQFCTPKKKYHPLQQNTGVAIVKKCHILEKERVYSKVTRYLWLVLWFRWHQRAAEGVCTVFPQTWAAALGLQLGSSGSLLRSLYDNLWGACWLGLTWEWYKLHPREPWDGVEVLEKSTVRVHCYTKFWRWLLAIWRVGLDLVVSVQS